MNDKRRLSGDWDADSYREYLMHSHSFIDGTNVMKGHMGKKKDTGFYGHVKSGSVKKGKIRGGC